MRRHLLTSAMSLALIGMPGVVLAQDADPDRGPAQIDDIIVTAQRREQNLQSVPIAVTAVTGEELVAAGVTGTTDLQAVVPGLIINKSGAYVTPFLRGVGAVDGTPGNEPPIATYVDGFYYGNASSVQFSFNNVARVEVLKGPQGTLFGRNATGGLIQVVTLDPSFEPVANLSLGYGSYDTWTGGAYLSTGLTDTIAADLALVFKSQGEGWGVNRVTGSEVGLSDEFGARTKLLWKPSEDTRVEAHLDFSSVDGDLAQARQAFPGALLSDGVTTYPGDPHDVAQSLDPGGPSRQWGGGVRVDHDFGSLRFASLTGFRRGFVDGVQMDQDSSPARLVDIIFNTRDKQFTQELQLLSDYDSPLTWIIGAFYYNAEGRNDPLALSGAAFTGVGGSLQRFSAQGTESFAAYAQGELEITPTTRLTAGIRQTRDERSIEGYDITPRFGRINDVDRSRTFEQLTWRVALDHDVTDNLMVYASANRGFKSGVFNTIAPLDLPVEPEILDAYEVGFKSYLFDRAVRLNGSAFFYDYQNIQLTSILAGVSRFLNAANAEIRGADLEAVWQVSERLQIQSSAEWKDGEYVRFPNGPLSTPRSTGGNLISSADLGGNRTIRTPEWAFNVGGTYTVPTTSGDWSVNANYAYMTEFFWEPDNRIKQPGYGLLNARIGWTAPDGQWGVDLSARNLTDQEYFIYGVSGSFGDHRGIAAPRTVGVTLTYHH